MTLHSYIHAPIPFQVVRRAEFVKLAERLLTFFYNSLTEQLC